MLRIRGRSVAFALAVGTVFAAASANADNFTVTNTDDNDLGAPLVAGSLRDTVAAAIAAGPSNTVIFGPAVTGTITLMSGQIRIDGPLTIIGPGRDVLAIDGNQNGRIFTVFENNAPGCPALSGPNDFLVTISSLTLKNGTRLVENSAGGAIQSAKSLTLDSVTIRDSSAWMGGGIGFNLQYPGQTLTITNSQFIDNFAKPTVAGTNGFHFGAGLAVQENCAGSFRGPTTPSTVSIENSLFSGNRTQPVNLMALGGAITSFSDADITITDTRVVDNHVERPASGARYYGGGVYGRAKSITIVGSEIADNTADRGGGLRLFNDVAALQGSASAMAVKIINSTISGNVVTNTGGALELYGNIALEIDNSTIANNNTLSNHTSGILLSTGAANPASAGNTRAPTLTLASSILANQPSLGGDVATNAALMPGFVIDASHSLIQKICSDPACIAAVTDSDNLLAIDPLLGPLADNGGLTRTHALLAGSPAIDTGSNPFGLATDQRGIGRQEGGAPDIGAFELVDATPPQFSCTPDGTWHSSDVTIACVASDPESGLENQADATFDLMTVTTSGTETASATTTSREVCNTLAECATVVPTTAYKVDKKAPSILCGAADAVWHNGDVSISCTASDLGSGLANLADASFNMITSVPSGTETANATTNGRQVCDAIGNCRTSDPIAGNKVDKKPPPITITSPAANATYNLNGSVGASYACTDGGSGLASCQGPVANGSPIDTSSTGTKTFTVNATDNVGNSSPLTVTYSVITGGGGGSTSADVGITLSVPNRVSPGGALMYSMTITNNSGKTTANGVVVSDALPAGTVFVSASASQGAVTAPAVGSNGTVTVNLGSLVGGANATINIIVTATAASGTVLTDIATVSATTQDLNSANNSATQKTTVSKK